MNSKITPGIPDAKFIRGKAPMTKEEVRVVAISKLDLQEDSRILDVGAGTGSVSIECARLVPKGHVYAFEKNEEALRLIGENAKQFNLNNITIVGGSAPESLTHAGEFNRVFVGGSSGNLPEILDWASENIAEDGKVVVTSVTFNTLALAWEYCRKNNLEYDIVQVAVTNCNKIKHIDMFKAQNPVYVIWANLKRKK